MLLQALAELGLIDEYEFVVQPRLAGPGADVVRGSIEVCGLKLVVRLRLGSGAVAMRYELRKQRPGGAQVTAHR